MKPFPTRSYSARTSAPTEARPSIHQTAPRKAQVTSDNKSPVTDIEVNEIPNLFASLPQTSSRCLMKKQSVLSIHSSRVRRTPPPPSASTPS
jgi:hypothetical protein